MARCRDCFHFDVCMDYTNLKESEFAQNYDVVRPICEHFVDKVFVHVTERWHSTSEICRYLDISRDTMLTWIAQKGLPGHKFGRDWKFKISEVDEWIKNGGNSSV